MNGTYVALGTRRRNLPCWRLGLLTIAAMVFGVPVADPASGHPEIVAAGDIARKEPAPPQRKTARLIRRIDPVAVLTLGDNQYPDGTLRQYRHSYDLTWGRFKGRTYPSPGNHDYHTPRAAGYFKYFGRRAHRGSGGMYSFNLGRWHLVSINSRTGRISDRKLRWVRRDLRKNRDRCELAYWHHPRWTSGSRHRPDPHMARLWRVLYRRGVDVVLNGHEHSYERFALMNPAGALAPRRGIREFVVGTGGGHLYPMGTPTFGSQKRIDDRFGVLRMVLRPRSYRWRFIAVDGAVLDKGRHGCHR
jgi:hypothetical protein